MAWTEDGYETHVLAPRRALRDRMATRLEEEAVQQFGQADSGRLHDHHHLRRLASRLRENIS